MLDVFSRSEAAHPNLRPIAPAAQKLDIVEPTIEAYQGLSDQAIREMADTAAPSDVLDLEDQADALGIDEDSERPSGAATEPAVDDDSDIAALRDDIAYNDALANFQIRIGDAFRSNTLFRDFDRIYKDTPAYNLGQRIFSTHAERRPNVPSPSTIRAKNITDAEKEAQKNAFSNKGRGRRVWEKVDGDYRLGVREIGVGYQDVLDIIDQNPTTLKSLIKDNTGIDADDIERWSVDEIVRFFRVHDVYVATFKPPHNSGPDQQCRILRVMSNQPRGIFMHPIVAPMYTADFDGDDANLSIDPNEAKYVKDPMELLIGTDGQLTLKLDWLSCVPIPDGNGMTARERVRNVILAGVSSVWNEHGLDRFCDAVIDLGNSYLESETDQKIAWMTMFRAAADVAYAKHPHDKKKRNKLAADMVEAVVSAMHQIALDRVFVGVDDRSLFDDASLPSVMEYDDIVIYNVAREYAQGRAPNNSQDLRVMLNSFIGYVRGKNPSFRFTADVGKMFKLDTRLRVGGGFAIAYDDVTGEYELDPDNEEHLNLMHAALLKWAESEAMQKEIKKAGHSQYYGDVMKTRVIKKVGFPTDKRYAGNFFLFLRNFYVVYNQEAEMINMSNLVSLTTGAIAEDSIRDSVSAIHLEEGQSFPKFSDLAEPLMTIYGSYSVGKMFQPLIDGNIMLPGYRDYNWKGSVSPTGHVGSNFVERNYEWLRDRDGRIKRRWIDGRYLSFSLRQFAHDNNLINGTYDSLKGGIEAELDFERGFVSAKMRWSPSKSTFGNIDIQWIDGNMLTFKPRRSEKKFVSGMYKDLDTGAEFELDFEKRTISTRISDLRIDNTDMLFYTLMAIADKGTGQASKYNKNWYGVGPENKVEKKKDEREARRKANKAAISKNNTVIGRIGMLLSDINRLSLQGTVLKPGHYAAIGEKGAPSEVQKAMEEVAAILANDDWVARSGHVEGADQAFERGAGGKADVYIPFPKFNSTTRIIGNTFSFDDLSSNEQRLAYASVDKYHPDASKLRAEAAKVLDQKAKGSDGKMKIQARSFFQICGRGSEGDSAFVACWVPANGKSHDADQALRIAKSRGIPVFNAAEYDSLDDWKRDVVEAARKSKNEQLKRVETRDQMSWINDIVEVLSHTDPDMFKYFGMDTASGFLQSKFGMALVANADDLEKLGGIWTTMLYEYRTADIISLHDKLQNMKTAGKSTTDALVDYEQRIEFAIGELSSSSKAWRGIIKELQAETTPGMTSVFRARREIEKWPMQRSPLRQYEWNPKYVEASAFWKDMGDHDTLLSVIEDLEMDRDLKWRIIADVVRFWENDPNFPSWAVGFQLDIGNSAAYNMNPANKRGVLTAARDFGKSFNKWSKTNQEKLQENIDRAYKLWGDVPGALMQTLSHLDKCPWDLISIDDGMYADGVMATFVKTYNDTEKGKIHPWDSTLYCGLSWQWNDGFMNDVTRTDDRLVGITATSTLGIRDVIHILANGDASLTVYDREGKYVNITRAQYLEANLGRPVSEDIERDLWEFFRSQPRIASAVRMHNACAIASSDGKGYVGARLSTAQTIRNCRSGSYDPIKHVKYLMRDHPIYAGIIGMALPAKGITARKHKQRFEKAEDYVARLIYKYAMMNDVCDSSTAARQILANLGITERSISDALMSDYDKFRRSLGMPVYKAEGGHNNSESAENALYTYIVAYKNLTCYIEDIQKNVDKESTHSVLTEPLNPPAGLRFDPDTESVAAFWDICQELGGAKTPTSTGIEGSETYAFNVWVDNIEWADKFADLQAIDDDVDESWVGCWTNLVNENGSPVLLQFDEEGILIEVVNKRGQATEYRNLQDAARSQGLDELIVMVPEGYTVPDKSIDSHGKQVPTLNASMTHKRSKGAEEKNLQTRKGGLDGTDSIVKMRGKYRQVMRDGVWKNVDFVELRDQLRVIASDKSVAPDGSIDEYGLLHAKLALAKMILDAHIEFGYKDVTLSNCMCLADLMLFIGDDGEVYLRTLEMLVSATRYGIGIDVDTMGKKEFKKAVRALIADTSETAIGRATMDASCVFDDFSPKGKAGAVNGINTRMVSFQRNYNLFEEILEQREAENFKAEMLPRTEAEKIDRVARESYGIGLSESEALPSLLDRVAIMRGYNVTRFVGATRKMISTGTYSYGVKVAPGFENAAVIGDGQTTAAEVRDMCDMAYRFGNTVIISYKHANLVPEKWLDDAISCSEYGDLMIPFFDILLNGCEAEPCRGKRFNVYQAPGTSFHAFVEDPINAYMLGDSMVKATRYLMDNVHLNDIGNSRVTGGELFPNIYQNEAYRDCTFDVHFTNGRGVAEKLARGELIDIDYGIPASSKTSFRQRKKDIDDAIDRYIDRIDKADSSGRMLGTELAPGDIVAWTEITIYNKYTRAVEFAYAPIIPFQLDGVKKGVPAKYEITYIGNGAGSELEHEQGSDPSWFISEWRNVSPIDGMIAKIHSPSGAADKGIVNFGDIIEDAMRFLDGTPVSAYIAKQSIGGRRSGTDRRIKTMVSAITLLRMHGYNFAESEGAFPDNANFPENTYIRDALKRDRIPASEWKRWLANGRPMLFSTDVELNLFLNSECRKILADGGNPSDYLACRFTDEFGNIRHTWTFWEFEAMFEQGLNYEDGLLRFMHACTRDFHPNDMCRGFCPNGIDDDGEYLFRLAKDDSGNMARDYDYGVLQMKAPFKNSGNSRYDGKTAYIWATVYIGQPFFGEDSSALSRSNIDGASRHLDAANTQGLQGMEYDEHTEKMRLGWATSDQGRRPWGANAISWDDEHSEHSGSDDEEI
ncbi:MAG: hypothetical protein K5859_03510 [Atopobiaceae bacterium]|nr:hypothetical protein [Atopobiaceae bacterium]